MSVIVHKLAEETVGQRCRQVQHVLWSARIRLWSTHIHLWSARTRLWSARTSLWSTRIHLWSARIYLWSARTTLRPAQLSEWTQPSNAEKEHHHHHHHYQHRLQYLPLPTPQYKKRSSPVTTTSTTHVHLRQMERSDPPPPPPSTPPLFPSLARPDPSKALACVFIASDPARATPVLPVSSPTQGPVSKKLKLLPALSVSAQNRNKAAKWNLSERRDQMASRGLG